MSLTDTPLKYHEGKSLPKTYLKYRPVYPQTMYDAILSYHKESSIAGFDLAVDVACGSGQLTVPFTEHFKQVIGLDLSKDQLACAPTDIPNMSFRVSEAEDMHSIQTGSVDMVTIATAVHFVKLEKFFKEVDRVLKPGGTFFIITYMFPEIEQPDDPDFIEKINYELLFQYVSIAELPKFEEFYNNLVTPFSSSERRQEFKMMLEWTLEHYVGFLKSGTPCPDIARDTVTVDGLCKTFGRAIPHGDEKKLKVKFRIPCIMCRKPE